MIAKNLCIRLFVIDEENLSDQDEGFALNATSMLDQTSTSLREDFVASK